MYLEKLTLCLSSWVTTLEWNVGQRKFPDEESSREVLHGRNLQWRTKLSEKAFMKPFWEEIKNFIYNKYKYDYYQKY